MKYRLGLDLGTNSIGWVIYKLNDQDQIDGFGDSGARIFGDGRDAKSGASLALDRRAARAARRRRDRYLRRREVLLQELTRLGLMPADEAERKAMADLEPYALRAKALAGPLPAHHVGRAVFHLNQRRGFKSNRKTDRKNQEKGKISQGIAELLKAMEEAGAETYGQYLYNRLQKGETVRARLDDGDGGYQFYPARHLLEEEFNAIWAAQAPHHPDIMTEKARQRLWDVIFYQRPLKEPKVGRCTLIPAETRLHKAHPLFQQRRLYEEVNALEIERTGALSRKLSLEQRDALILKLKGNKTASFSALRKAIKLEDASRFNKETENRSSLKGDEVAAEMSHKSRFHKDWFHFDTDKQWRIIEKVLHEEDPAKLHDWLSTECGLDDERALAVADARLPEGYGRFGETATKAILRELKKHVVVYSQAIANAPELGHHSDFRTGEIWDALPYYGRILDRHIPPGSGEPDDSDEKRFGRITNPTVHIGLGQLRRVVNALIKRYGHPTEIAVELARDLKLNAAQKEEVNKKIKENTVAAQRRSKDLEQLGEADKGRNRLMLRLWEELNPHNPLDRRCPYCGSEDNIGMEMLFSSAIDIDHILPYSQTLDDSPANKTVCHAACNRYKCNRTPYGRFGGNDARWARIQDIAARLPGNKRWRFAPDAMEEFEKHGDFQARQLTDTQYLSRLAKAYLEAVCPKGVYVSPGKLTEMLRRHWGLNSLLNDHNQYDTAQKKNRQDHRHHTIDAAVIGATDRSLLQRIATEAGRREAQELDDVIGAVAAPWEGFRESLGWQLERLVVSHRPDHGTVAFEGRRLGRDQTTGRLHNDTAYGLTGEKDGRGNDLVVHRAPLASLKSVRDIERVRDNDLRDALWEATRGLEGKSFEAAIAAFPKTSRQYAGIRRVRIVEPLSVIPIKDKKGRAYKGYKGDANHCYEVWQLPDGVWKAVVLSRYEAHQPDLAAHDRRPHPAAKRVLKLHQNDMLAIEDGGKRHIMRIVKFSLSGQIALAPHNEANVDARNRNKDDPFKLSSPTASGLKKLKARQLRVTELGKIIDPGFKQED